MSSAPSNKSSNWNSHQTGENKTINRRDRKERRDKGTYENLSIG